MFIKFNGKKIGNVLGMISKLRLRMMKFFLINFGNMYLKI